VRAAVEVVVCARRQRWWWCACGGVRATVVLAWRRQPIGGSGMLAGGPTRPVGMDYVLFWKNFSAERVPLALGKGSFASRIAPRGLCRELALGKSYAKRMLALGEGSESSSSDCSR
jgi:hypothetical protein